MFLSGPVLMQASSFIQIFIGGVGITYQTLLAGPALHIALASSPLLFHPGCSQLVRQTSWDLSLLAANASSRHLKLDQRAPHPQIQPAPLSPSVSFQLACHHVSCLCISPSIVDAVLPFKCCGRIPSIWCVKDPTVLLNPFFFFFFYVYPFSLKFQRGTSRRLCTSTVCGNKTDTPYSSSSISMYILMFSLCYFVHFKILFAPNKSSIQWSFNGQLSCSSSSKNKHYIVERKYCLTLIRHVHPN